MKFNEIKIGIYLLMAVFSFGFSGREVMAKEWVFEELEAVISPADTQPVTDSTLVGPPNTFGRYIETPEYSGYVLPLFAEAMYSDFNNYSILYWLPSDEWDLSDEDIALAEEILRDKLKEYCIAEWATIPEELADLNIFIRQYSGNYQSYGKFKGERTVRINLVNKDDYEKLEKNRPEYFTKDRALDKGHIYEVWIPQGLYFHYSDDSWYTPVAISVYIDFDKRCIESIDYRIF